MFKADQPPPFLEIPASMMEKMLDKTDEIGTIINESINSIRKNKDKFRFELIDLINNDKILNNIEISTCGIDGAYIVERLLGTDLLFSCALVTEGLFSKSQKISSSPLANYDVFVYPEKHNAENEILARAIMLQMEIKLAASAPYDIIYMDGSLTTALIHMYKAVNMIKDNESFVSNKIKENFEEFLISYKKILLGENENKIWLGIPKYTSRNDIGQRLDWPPIYDDRAILTMVLEPGEYTTPVLFTNEEGWHSNLPYQNDTLDNLMEDIISGIRKLNVIYYKPYNWSPAIRIEMPFYVAEDKNKLGILLQNLKQQCEIPSILEPYPLYMADRIAKRISPAIPAYKQIIINKMINEPDQNEIDVLFMMHSYRTEAGYN
ncbi:MAG: DNA double-strand break repair nuclease NurA [Candidatus Nitrosocosmicus sp.]